MQICQGVAEINGITLHYKSTKNLTLCQCKFNGRFIKINLYVRIHHTQPGDGPVSIQLPSITDHSDSACVAAGLSTHLWYLMQQHTGLTKSALTLLLHNRNTTRHQNSIQEQLLQFPQTQHGYTGSPPAEHIHEFRLRTTLAAWHVGTCWLSHSHSAHACLQVCMCSQSLTNRV